MTNWNFSISHIMSHLFFKCFFNFQCDLLVIINIFEEFLVKSYNYTIDLITVVQSSGRTVTKFSLKMAIMKTHFFWMIPEVGCNVKTSFLLFVFTQTFSKFEFNFNEHFK